jgi:hypothetical protein
VNFSFAGVSSVLFFFDLALSITLRTLSVLGVVAGGPDKRLIANSIGSTSCLFVSSLNRNRMSIISWINLDMCTSGSEYSGIFIKMFFPIAFFSLRKRENRQFSRHRRRNLSLRKFLKNLILTQASQSTANRFHSSKLNRSFSSPTTTVNTPKTENM